MDIRCRKTDCKYNDFLTCTAPNITITNKIICDMYEKGKEKIDISKQIFSETPPEIKDYKHLRDMCLVCQTDCLFNREGNCIANGITINDIHNSAKCITYAKK